MTTLDIIVKTRQSCFRVPRRSKAFVTAHMHAHRVRAIAVSSIGSTLLPSTEKRGKCGCDYRGVVREGRHYWR